MPIKTGISDGVFTEVVEGALHPGEELVVGVAENSKKIRRAVEVLMTDLIVTERLTKHYVVGTQEVPALTDVSITVDRGEFGCGHHGRVRFRQIDADEPDRLPRYADLGGVTG
ncbi:MAG: hypothetical protein U1E43_04645 [Rhodospirillales bacterium]